MSRVVLIDSGGCNIGSVQYALQRLGCEAPLTRDVALIRAAERVILPGVGAAAVAMQALDEAGLIPVIKALRQPLLGVCVGMQILFEHSEEGDVDCLGLLPGKVRKLAAAPGVRVPHMGWNRLQPLRASRLLAGLPEHAWAYYVHSYAVDNSAAAAATCVHGDAFVAVAEQDNVAGVQFHPERSAAVGARILQNFIQ